MSVNVDMKPRDLWVGVFKIAAVLAFGLVLAAFILSQLILDNDSSFPRVGLIALALAFAFNLIANGFLAILKIIDWFEGRRSKQEATHG